MTDKNKSNDQQAVSQLYQKLDREKPSEALDQTILNFAAKGAGNTASQTDSAVPPQRVKVSRLRRWQWPLGLAASVGFVWFILYGQLHNFDPMLRPADPTTAERLADWQVTPDTHAPDPELANSPELTDSSQVQDEFVRTESSEKEQPTIVFKPAMTDYKALAERERIAERKKLQQQVQSELSQEVVKADENVDIALSFAPLEEVESIVVSGSRVEETKAQAAIEAQADADAQHRALAVEHKQLERQSSREGLAQQETAPVFLQSLYDEYQNIDTVDISEQQKAKKKTELAESVYQYLWQLRLLNPEQKVADRFFTILNQEQRLSLQSGKRILSTGAGRDKGN